MDYLMAIDLGSTTLKALVYDLDGNCVASANRPTEKVTPPDHHEWVTWDPDQIWSGAAAAASEAVAKLGDPSLIRGVAVTGMGMDGVPVDRDGNHLYPFISWHDPRTAPQAEWWKSTVGAERAFSITGFPAWAITGVMRVLWMKEHEPEIMAKAHKWLLIEDFLNFRLCGVMATDFSMASCMNLLDQRTQRWSDELLADSGIDPALLPAPRQSGTPLGKVTAEAAALTGLAEGTPVILGGHDHICGTLPSGVYKPGSALDVIGTWESVITTLSTPALTPAVHDAAVCMQSHVAKGMYAAWGGAVAGESIEWYRREFGFEAKLEAEQKGGSVWKYLLGELGNTEPGASGVFYLPHISAAGCPIDDNKSLGAFVGISNTATKADMLRAVIEGMNYQFLHIIESMGAAMDEPIDRMIVTGGVVQNEFWMQNKADMLGLPVEISEVEESTPLGAAMLAGLGLGLYGSIDEAYERVRRVGHTYQPDTTLTSFYRENFEIYKSIYPALKPVSHRIFDAFKN